MLKKGLIKGAGLCAGIAAALLLSSAVSPATAATDPVVQVPVSFQVQNVNRTSVLCGSDGQTHTVRGHIVATQSELANSNAATLYLHAVTLGEYYWDLQNPAGYDFAAQEAQDGHTSVIIDRLGYGASDHPNGWETCFGSEADVAHQIIQQLRAGSYQSGSAAPLAFSHMYLAGSSVGGLTTNVEAYTFHDVDGIMNLSWGDFTPTVFTSAELTNVLARCALGGDPGTPGYAAFAKDARDEFYFHSASSEVRAAVPALKPDPCGQLASIPAALAEDVLHLNDIKVPVLNMFGGSDPVFGPQPLSTQQQSLRYSGSSDVTTSIIQDASHYPLFESNHLQVVSVISNWLNARN